MSQLVVAMTPAGAARRAKQAGLKGRWQAVTPDNYETVLDGLAVPREHILWDYTETRDGDWSFPVDMLKALRAVIHRAQT